MSDLDWRTLDDESYKRELFDLITNAASLNSLRTIVHNAIYGKVYEAGVKLKIKTAVNPDNREMSITFDVIEDRGCLCVGCGRRMVFEYMPSSTTQKKLLCRSCHGPKERTREIVKERQGGRCIYPGCDKIESSRGYALHLHRVKPGREGGGYFPDNCVLACASHHRIIEGMTWQELDALIPYANSRPARSAE